MPVASYIDIEILCLVRLIGMCIPDKHIRRGSDDPLVRAPWDKDLSKDLCEIFLRSLCSGSHAASRLLQINIPSRKNSIN